jgi:hypothetical protein
MGLLLVDKSADFSGSAIGDAGLYTSITTGLTALHETRRIARKACNNAVANQPNGTVLGNPTLSAGYGTFDLADSIKFGTKPASGGLTLAIVYQNYNRATQDPIVGSTPGTSSTQGFVQFKLLNRRLTFEAYDYPYPATYPLSGFADVSCFIDMAAGDDGNYELFFGVLEDNVSLRLYRPKTKTLATTARVGRAFAFDGPVNFQLCPTTVGGTINIAAFGQWQAVLSTANMDTIYGELQAQAANYGLTIA